MAAEQPPVEEQAGQEGEVRHPVEELIDELEELAERGVRWYCRVMPPFWGKTVIDHAEFLDLTRRLRQALPEEMSQAIHVARERERIIREAQEQRDRIIQAAREQAQILVSNDELVRQAQAKADQILKAAQTEAEALKAEAQAWVRGVIERLETNVRRVLNTLERARQALGAPAQEPTSAGAEQNEAGE